ncbi:thiamine pyrophosphate-binding protein [Paramicrobacterium agarici]|uniref:thiamine pyrophosphate-binding protein n=1 Tax=Paramicrobacterium agarici TaxID=630514 RepID=UPI001150B133|nr:thiamine pyrophosphate-binding protein [Microbacterium agarici]TQO23765.1 thiamine pyrophosphate-dependent acetolactate synthase large subunit-like protein [Microbacterium agarici]
MPTVSAHIATTLAAHVTDMFGVMGNGNAYLLDALADTPVSYTAVRHEAGTVAAADAYYRTCGRIAVATSTYGPGFTNTITPLAEAVKAHTPLVLVTGAAPTTGLRPWDVDQAALCRAVGAHVVTVSQDSPVASTRAVLEYALTHRTAVVLEIPYDVGGLEALDGVDTASAPLAVPAPQPPRAHDLDVAARALHAARRPLLLAGRGAFLSGAANTMRDLADRLGALTASSALGRGQFDARYDLGVAGGFGQDNAMQLATTADVVLVIGAGLNQFTMRFGALIGDDATVVQLDVEDAPTSDRVDVFVSGDARTAVEGLNARLADSASSGWRDSVTGFADGTLTTREPGDRAASDGLLDPRSLTKRLNEIIPDDRVMVTDGGHFLGWVNQYFDVASPDRFAMVGTPFQSIGLGLPSLVGSAAARPEEFSVLCTGDGGGLMALADLESAVRTVKRGVIIVYNDAAYGAEIHLYGLAGFDAHPMMISGVDFAGLARSVGADAVTVNTLDDLDVFERWVASGDDGVMLLDCRITQSLRAPYQEEVIAQNSALFAPAHA